jgi:sulfur relay (sulfurtransferase) complex TusBCD TusD component (DsrE family)
MKLAILLASPPGGEDARTARRLAAAARRQGHEAYVFFNADGVLSAAALADLGELGVQLGACALSARQRGIPLAAGIHWGSQMDWAEAVRSSDRVVVFG